jgi:hypothetical protein
LTASLLFPGALVVIHDLHAMRITITPGAADAPLIIDSNAVRACAVASQQFKLISRGQAEILQPQCPMQV